MVLLFAEFLFRIWSEPFFLFYVFKTWPRLTLINNDFKLMKQLRQKKPLLCVGWKWWREKERGSLDPFGGLILWRARSINFSNWSCFLNSGNASFAELEVICLILGLFVISNKYSFSDIIAIFSWSIRYSFLLALYLQWLRCAVFFHFLVVFTINIGYSLLNVFTSPFS